MLEIKNITFEEISVLEEFKNLCTEYGEEGKIEGLPKGEVNYNMYKQYESAGVLCIFGAFFDSKLIGFIFLLTIIYPHRTIKMTVEESIFVSKQYRKTGAGTRLISEAEKYAKQSGSLGNVFTAPADGTLDKVLTGKKYKKIQHIFLKTHE